jgi:hypothetical protein
MFLAYILRTSPFIVSRLLARGTFLFGTASGTDPLDLVEILETPQHGGTATFIGPRAQKVQVQAAVFAFLVWHLFLCGTRKKIAVNQ